MRWPPWEVERNAALIFEALCTNPAISSEHQYVVKLGASSAVRQIGAHEISREDARVREIGRATLSGLLCRRIPCLLDEAAPAFSITLSCTNGTVAAIPSTTSVRKLMSLGPNDNLAVDADTHLDNLAFELAVRHRVQRFTDSNIAHNAEATAALQAMRPCPEALDRSIRSAIQSRELEAAMKRGICPWRRSRLMVVGQGRAGKTAFVASLYGDHHTGKSTCGIVISDASIRDCGVEIQAGAVVEDAGNIRWEKSRDGPEADRAVAVHAARCAHGATGYRSALAPLTLTDALQTLHKKYGFGDGSKIIDEDIAQNKAQKDIQLGDDANDSHNSGATHIDANAAATANAVSEMMAGKQPKTQQERHKAKEKRHQAEGERHRIVPEEQFEPDSASDSCRLCKKTFWIFRRRHHCRLCGRLVCDKCSTYAPTL